MKLLALDTSTEACSAALYVNGETISRFELAPRRHAELILPMIDDVLSEAEFSLKQLDALGFGRGPGAFTGVRIATSITQGLAFATDLPVVPVSSLAALAQGTKDKADYIIAAIDARMREIYYGIYRINKQGIVELNGEEHVCSPDKVNIPESITSCYGAGTGWLHYEKILAGRSEKKLLGFDGDRYPNAIDIATLAVAAFNQGGAVPLDRILPVYLRDNVTG
ncbi:MAG: tRNA (adenosine(37)-N6)-threonylcarbamoyltransferase complex dimerization subunit type 1 TsaB [Gammaproteobacteria bacterium]|nr:tRNA (adenosine(37)-N6)-threonylcarbamoyltransferase complex dimerization subunit type 1 TsaB [Gammaproteobacteria bacterium]